MATSSSRQGELQTSSSNPSIRRSSGRRKPKSGGGAADSKKKKLPQRGMGVAKLEKLRMQNPETVHQQSPGFLSFTNPVHHLPAYSGFQHGSDHHRFLHNHLQHVFGIHDSDFLPKNCNVIPGNVAVKCYSLHCNACHKKKKINNGENIGVGSEICKAEDDQSMMMVNNQDIMLNFGAKSPQPVGNYGNKVEVVAVHRKGSSSIWDAEANRVLMEYDFFPVAKSGGVCDSDGGELAVMKQQPAGFEASNCVDLSLKLSNY